MPGQTHTKSMMSMREWMIELIVFALGGAAYGLMEILFRGHTHWSMVLTGGACVTTLYILLGWLDTQPLASAALTGAAVITLYEFAVGWIVNLRLGWNVWDYSAMAGNVMGQICPQFSLVWFCLCFVFLGAVRLLS